MFLNVRGDMSWQVNVLSIEDESDGSACCLLCSKGVFSTFHFFARSSIPN